MFNKAIYFRVGERDVRIALPQNPLSRFLAALFAVLFIVDLISGNLLGALLMFVFLAIHVVDIR